MLYRGFWIDFVDLTSSHPDGAFDAVFLIRKRHSREILAEASSISHALAIVRDIIGDKALQTILDLEGAA